MRILLALILMVLSCTSVDTPAGQEQLGALIASVYKYKEPSMPAKYRISAKIAYLVLGELVETASDENDLSAIRKAIEEYCDKNQVSHDQRNLALLTFTQVYHRAKLGELAAVVRLDRLRHIKRGIDSIID